MKVPTVRAARGEDAPALTDLILRSKRSNGYDEAFMAACADELAMTPDIIARTRCWVAETDVLAGCICLNTTDLAQGQGRIESFFIAPEAKRQGIGRLLWHVVLQASRDSRLTRLTLDADPAAVQFYAAMGFRIFREVPSGSIPGRMLPQMEYFL